MRSALIPFLLALAACTPAVSPPIDTPPAPADPPAVVATDVLDRARQAAGMLGTTLKERLLAAVAASGPAGAAAFCSEEAQGLTAEIAARYGSDLRLGRSSVRLRNPANVAPPWVAQWLATTGERKAEGVAGIERVVEGPHGSVAQVLVPIAVGEPCLLCHGPAEALAPEVSALLATRYPMDRAVGYQPGDLRGALWVEAGPAGP